MMAYSAGPPRRFWGKNAIFVVLPAAPSAGTGRSGLPSAVATQPFLALGRPDLVDLVARLECRHALRQGQPRQLAARVDVNIRPDRVRCVERPGAHKQAVAGHDVIAAPQGGAAALAKEDVVVLAGTPRQPERLRRHRAGFDELPLDPDVDHERTAGQTLTVATVTGVHDQRTLGQPVSDRSARASALEIHRSSSAGPSGIALRAIARSTARHRYQLATVRYGFHRAP